MANLSGVPQASPRVSFFLPPEVLARFSSPSDGGKSSSSGSIYIVAKSAMPEVVPMSISPRALEELNTMPEVVPMSISPRALEELNTPLSRHSQLIEQEFIRAYHASQLSASISDTYFVFPLPGDQEPAVASVPRRLEQKKIIRYVRHKQMEKQEREQFERAHRQEMDGPQREREARVNRLAAQQEAQEQANLAARARAEQIFMRERELNKMFS